MPGTMITELYRKRRASDVDEGTVSSKKSKTSAECSVPMQCTGQPPAEVSDAAAKLSMIPEDQVAGSRAGHAALPKENRSPNLTLLDHLEAESDTYTDIDQATSGQETSAAPTNSSEGLLNLLLLADSSLQDCDNDLSNDMPNLPEAMPEQMTDDATPRGTEDTATASMSPRTAGSQQSTSDASQQRSVSAGLRPRITAQTAAVMSVNMIMDSDNSSSDEEQPTPIKRHKGMGRYGQELGNIAAQALKHTTMLKKKCTNRTNKTMRQLRTARDGNRKAAEKAMEATRAAQKAVHHLASFADAFDDLVKEAVHTANAAAQSRADYAASVIAAELAEARGGTVASKRGKRRSTSPKTLKRLAWAAEEHLIQHRIFSKAEPPSAASFNCAAVQ